MERDIERNQVTLPKESVVGKTMDLGAFENSHLKYFQITYNLVPRMEVFSVDN